MSTKVRKQCTKCAKSGDPFRVSKAHTHTSDTCGSTPKVRKECTNPLCIAAGSQRGHNLEDCGRQGGGAHSAYIADKKHAAMAAKHQAKVALMEEVYPKILANVLQANASVNTYDQIMGMCPELNVYTNPPPQEGAEVVSPAERLARKLAGMILERKISELRTIISTPELLANEMADGLVELVKAAEAAE